MNTLNGYSKGTLSDNYLLSAAGGHIPLGNSSGDVPLNNNTLNKDLFADKAQTLPYFTIPSSGELSKDTNDATKLIPKYIKIGTINIPLTSWYRGSIMLIFHDYEIYKLNGDILMIQCTTGGNKVGALPAIRWKTKHDKSTEDSIIISKVDDNTYDLYFEAKFSWMTFYVYYLTKEEGVFNFNLGSWSLVKPNPITTRSTLLNVSSEALTLSPEYVANLNDVARDTFIDGRFLATNTPYSNYFTGISLSNSELKYKYLFGFSTTGIPFVRYNNNSTWLPWKLLASMTDIPTSLKNPNALTIFGINYDGSVAQTITANTMISTLSEGTSDVTDNTEILTSYASDNGFADTNAPNTVYKRDAIKVYNYIKGKLDNVYLKNSEGVIKLNSFHSQRPTTPDEQYTDNALRYYLATGLMTTNKPATDGYILQFSWDNSGYNSWLSIPSGSGSNSKIQYRTTVGSSYNQIGSWVDVLDSNMLLTATAKTNLGWDNTTANKLIPTIGTLAFWTGAYNSSNNSNLQYCTTGEIVGTNLLQKATNVTSTNFSDNHNANLIVPTMGFISWWNGAWNTSNDSNLTYSANGTIIGTNNYTTYTVKKVSGYTTTTNNYVKLGTLPTSSAATYDSFVVQGSVGGYTSNTKSHIDISVSRRDGITYRGFLQHINTYDWDLGVNDVGEIFLILPGNYCAWSLSLHTIQGTIDYQTSATPTDTNWTLLSKSTSILKLSKEGAVVTIHTLNRSDDLNSKTTDSVWASRTTSVCASLNNKPTNMPEGEVRLKVENLDPENKGEYVLQTLYAKNTDTWGVWLRMKSNTTFYDWKKVAWVSDIPTKVSQLTNDSNYVTGGPYLPTAGGAMTGNITVYTGADGRGLVFGTSKLNSLSNQLIWQSSEAIRFGSSSWDWNSWAGLKYDSTNKIIYLGIPDNVIFNANSAQSGGQIKFPGVASLYMGSTNLTESTLNIVNTAGGKDLGLTIQGTLKKIGFMIGSGNSNNGWYDFTSGVDKWIMYRSSNAGNVIFNYPVLSSKFVGDVTGNATSATKATQDGDGNTISSTYFKKLSRPDTGFNIDEIELFGMRDILPSSEITRAGTFPFDLWGSLMSFNGQNYFVQLATQGTSSGMYFRSAYGGGIKLTDKPWVKFLDSSNYTNYTVNKDGTGASGTWGINITGSSNSASYANRLTEYHNLDRQHDLDVIEPWNMPIGIMIRFKNPTGANTRAIGSQWNTIVSMNGYVGSSTSGAGYRHEFLFSDSLNHNDGTFWVRNGVDDLWNDWVKVVTAKNYKDAIPTATTSAAGLMSTSDKTKLDAVDSTYLKLTGGQISSSATTPLSINSTSGTESGLRFDVNKVSSGWVGYDTTNGVQLFSYKGGSKILGIKDDGTPHFSGNTLLHGANYTNYTVKKDGTGAAGTWNISITGSSGSCTGNAATATCIQRPSANTTELPTGTTVCSDGMKFVRSVYNTVNRPATYGNVIQIGGSGHSQLFLEWSGSSATTGKVYYKSKRDVSTTEWGDWVQLIDERDVVTTSKAGLMSAADKTKLDGITGSVTNNLVIKLNNGTAEGTNLFTFNGSEAKTINITPASINALASNGTASAAIRLSSKGDNTNANTLCFYSASISSTTLSAMNSWTRPTDGSNNAMVLRMYKTANTGHDIYAASDKDSLWHRNSSNATSKWAKILDSLNCYGIYNITINSNNISIEHISGKQLIPNINEIPIQGANRAYYAWTADETPDSYDELVFLILPKATVLSGGGFYYYNLTAVVNQYGIYIICDSNDPSGLRGYASDNVPCRTIIFHL